MYKTPVNHRNMEGTDTQYFWCFFVKSVKIMHIEMLRSFDKCFVQPPSWHKQNLEHNYRINLFSDSCICVSVHVLAQWVIPLPSNADIPPQQIFVTQDTDSNITSVAFDFYKDENGILSLHHPKNAAEVPFNRLYGLFLVNVQLLMFI